MTRYRIPKLSEIFRVCVTFTPYRSRDRADDALAAPGLADHTRHLPGVNRSGVPRFSPARGARKARSRAVGFAHAGMRRASAAAQATRGMRARAGGVHACVDRSRRVVRPEAAEAEAVGDDEGARAGHGGAGHERAEQPGGGERQGGDVVGEGPEQVALDGAQRPAGESDGVGRGRRSPETRVMSEASMATSVPVPIARPRSAWASPGASLTPSPTIATTRPSAWRRRTTLHLVGGEHLGDHLGDADLRRRPLRRWPRLSPVRSTGRRPSALSAATASADVALTVSATASMPRTPPSHAAITAVCPCDSAARRASSIAVGRRGSSRASATAGPPARRGRRRRLRCRGLPGW